MLAAIQGFRIEGTRRVEVERVERVVVLGSWVMLGWGLGVLGNG